MHIDMNLVCKFCDRPFVDRQFACPLCVDKSKVQTHYNDARLKTIIEFGQRAEFPTVWFFELDDGVVNHGYSRECYGDIEPFWYIKL